MRDSWRASIPKKSQTKLVISGIYKFSRNPAFLGFDLQYTGVLLLYFNPLTVLFSVFAAVPGVWFWLVGRLFKIYGRDDWRLRINPANRKWNHFAGDWLPHCTAAPAPRLRQGGGTGRLPKNGCAAIKII